MVVAILTASVGRRPFTVYANRAPATFWIAVAALMYTPGGLWPAIFWSLAAVVLMCLGKKRKAGEWFGLTLVDLGFALIWVAVVAGSALYGYSKTVKGATAS